MASARWRIGLGLLPLVVVSLATAPAESASGSGGDAVADKNSVETCVQNMATGSYKCWESLDAMLLERTGGRVALKASAAGELPMQSSTVAAVEAATSSSINAIFYDVIWHGGAQLLMEAPTGCDNNTDIDWQWGALTGAWKNRISSGEGFSNCDYKLFDFDNFKGASTAWSNFDGSIGAMTDAANSVRMR